jgi:hypothetical protein
LRGGSNKAEKMILLFSITAINIKSKKKEDLQLSFTQPNCTIASLFLFDWNVIGLGS